MGEGETGVSEPIKNNARVRVADAQWTLAHNLAGQEGTVTNYLGDGLYEIVVPGFRLGCRTVVVNGMFLTELPPVNSQ